MLLISLSFGNEYFFYRLMVRKAEEGREWKMWYMLGKSRLHHVRYTVTNYVLWQGECKQILKPSMEKEEEEKKKHTVPKTKTKITYSTLSIKNCFAGLHRRTLSGVIWNYIAFVSVHFSLLIPRIRISILIYWIYFFEYMGAANCLDVIPTVILH